jgi:hypothetical protein
MNGKPCLSKRLTRLLLGLSFNGAQRQRIRQLIGARWQRQQQREMKAASGTNAQRMRVIRPCPKGAPKRPRSRRKAQP